MPFEERPGSDDRDRFDSLLLVGSVRGPDESSNSLQMALIASTSSGLRFERRHMSAIAVTATTKSAIDAITTAAI